MVFPLRLREAFNLGGLTARELAVRTWKKVNDHEIMTRASAVAFYAMLALVPFLGMILTLAVQLLPDLTGQSGKTVGIGNMTVERLDTTLRTMFPKEAYEVVKNEIADIQRKPPVGLISIGLVVTIWLASSLFTAVIDAMNRIYGVGETRPFWKTRLIAIAMTIVQAAILIGSLVLIVAWSQIVSWMHLSAAAAAVATVVQWIVVVIMILLSFALAYYVGPDAEQNWEWITPGSLLGTIVLLAVTFGFRVYVQHFADYNKTYGSLGGVMVLMFWFWISSLVLLTAGQVNKIIEDASPLGKTYGQKVNPTLAPDLRAIKPEPASS